MFTKEELETLLDCVESQIGDAVRGRLYDGIDYDVGPEQALAAKLRALLGTKEVD